MVFAGLKTTERHAHTYEPSYVTPGEDAMVSYDGYAGPDLRFVNNSKTAVGIKAAYSKQTLTVSIYGTLIREDGVTVFIPRRSKSWIRRPRPMLRIRHSSPEQKSLRRRRPLAADGRRT